MWDTQTPKVQFSRCVHQEKHQARFYNMTELMFPSFLSVTLYQQIHCLLAFHLQIRPYLSSVSELYIWLIASCLFCCCFFYLACLLGLLYTKYIATASMRVQRTNFWLLIFKINEDCHFSVLPCQKRHLLEPFGAAILFICMHAFMMVPYQLHRKMCKD